MVTAFVHIVCKPERLEDIAESISQMDGISEVYSITGDFDLLAIVRVASIDELPEIVADNILKQDGIIKASTSIGFKVFSRHNLEAMFSIGLE
ncbi:MAG: Lrp/AsnC ligand binding domain-containing protein [Deltaproteobacteria bacterium]|nr:Lrp/AsnC ligand binding domain-containing protein [Deltaproteobacteria bacterium]MCL5791840.1 Lrp/AsnC ligand binding domain-containing protein [Deltaproteobacteria bacterium]